MLKEAVIKIEEINLEDIEVMSDANTPLGGAGNACGYKCAGINCGIGCFGYVCVL